MELGEPRIISETEKMGRRTLGWKEVDFNNWLENQAQEQ